MDTKKEKNEMLYTPMVSIKAATIKSFIIEDNYKSVSIRILKILRILFHFKLKTTRTFSPIHALFK